MTLTLDAIQEIAEVYITSAFLRPAAKIVKKVFCKSLLTNGRTCGILYTSNEERDHKGWKKELLVFCRC